jgi:hypothetical protein
VIADAVAGVFVPVIADDAVSAYFAEARNDVAGAVGHSVGAVDQVVDVRRLTKLRFGGQGWMSLHDSLWSDEYVPLSHFQSRGQKFPRRICQTRSARCHVDHP